MKVGNQIGVIFIVFLLSAKALVAPLLLLDYQWRKAYIIENYCVNKNRPELHCDGKCYLAKRIQQAQQQEEQQATQQFADKFFVVETTTTPPLAWPPSLVYNLVAAVALPPYQIHAYSAPSLGIFHPPQV